MSKRKRKAPTDTQRLNRLLRSDGRAIVMAWSCTDNHEVIHTRKRIDQLLAK